MTTPATLGAMVDAYYKARAARLAAEKKIEAMKAKEADAKEAILARLTEEKLDGAKGKLATCAITQTDVPKIEDHTAFFAYVKENDAFDLVEKRAVKSACEARWSEGVKIPGVVKFHKTDLSFTKSGGK